MKKTRGFLLAAGIMLAMAFTFSCSSGDDDGGGSSPSQGGQGTVSSSSDTGNQSSSSSGGGNGNYCGGTSFTPSSEFCYNNTVYKKCPIYGDRIEYNPTERACAYNFGEWDLYVITIIGTQTWMVKNSNDGVSGSICPYSDPDRCTVFYGRLYDWATAMNIPLGCNEGPRFCYGDGFEKVEIQPKHRGICPEGWHIPTKQEWEILINNAGGETNAGRKLKAGYAWADPGKGTDDYGFEALPGGGYYENSGLFSGDGRFGAWWSSTQQSGQYAYHIQMDFERDDAGMDSSPNKDKLSVRCLKD